MSWQEHCKSSLILRGHSERKRKRKKMKRQIKELRKLVARVGNEIYRRKHWRKATHKEKRIIEELKKKANSNLNTVQDVRIAKEIWLDKLRGKIAKMERYKERDKAMKSNNIFQKDEGNFYKKTNEGSKYKCKY